MMMKAMKIAAVLIGVLSLNCATTKPQKLQKLSPQEVTCVEYKESNSGSGCDPWALEVWENEGFDEWMDNPCG
jgi:hypothetical protein